MFNKPLETATYDDVLAFCGTFTEGVRVEYKRTPVNIPKVVSSLANTVGGIWVIGLETDAANRAILPPVGLPLTPGIEEQIVVQRTLRVADSTTAQYAGETRSMSFWITAA
jgi:hypothetical protein